MLFRFVIIGTVISLIIAMMWWGEMKKLLLILICLFVSFEVKSKDIKSITKLIDYEKCMKELEDDDTKIVNSTINRKSGELHLYFHNNDKMYRLHLTGNEGICLVYEKWKLI